MTITSPVRQWQPPQGMPPLVVRAWRAFYGKAWKLYRITPEQYRALYLAQLGRCYICQKAKGIHPDDPSGKGARRLGVDHNHLIGNNVQAVRGLLCTGSLSANTCNRLIARYPHDALRRAVEYVQRPPAQDVLRRLALEPDVDPTGWAT
jgi:hypothetical protein